MSDDQQQQGFPGQFGPTQNNLSTSGQGGAPLNRGRGRGNNNRGNQQGPQGGPHGGPHGGNRGSPRGSVRGRSQTSSRGSTPGRSPLSSAGVSPAHSSSGEQPRNSTRSGPKCNRCKQSGHIARNCPNNSAGPRTPRPAMNPNATGDIGTWGSFAANHEQNNAKRQAELDRERKMAEQERVAAGLPADPGFNILETQHIKSGAALGTRTERQTVMTVSIPPSTLPISTPNNEDQTAQTVGEQSVRTVQSQAQEPVPAQDAALSAPADDDDNETEEVSEEELARRLEAFLNSPDASASDASLATTKEVSLHPESCGVLPHGEGEENALYPDESKYSMHTPDEVDNLMADLPANNHQQETLSQDAQSGAMDGHSEEQQHEERSTTIAEATISDNEMQESGEKSVSAANHHVPTPSSLSIHVDAKAFMQNLFEKHGPPGSSIVTLKPKATKPSQVAPHSAPQSATQVPTSIATSGQPAPTTNVQSIFEGLPVQPTTSMFFQPRSPTESDSSSSPPSMSPKAPENVIRPASDSQDVPTKTSNQSVTELPATLAASESVASTAPANHDISAPTFHPPASELPVAASAPETAAPGKRMINIFNGKEFIFNPAGNQPSYPPGPSLFDNPLFFKPGPPPPPPPPPPPVQEIRNPFSVPRPPPKSNFRELFRKKTPSENPDVPAESSTAASELFPNLVKAPTLFPGLANNIPTGTPLFSFLSKPATAATDVPARPNPTEYSTFNPRPAPDSAVAAAPPIPSIFLPSVGQSPQPAETDVDPTVQHSSGSNIGIVTNEAPHASTDVQTASTENSTLPVSHTDKPAENQEDDDPTNLASDQASKTTLKGKKKKTKTLHGVPVVSEKELLSDFQQMIQGMTPVKFNPVTKKFGPITGGRPPSDPDSSSPEPSPPPSPKRSPDPKPLADEETRDSLVGFVKKQASIKSSPPEGVPSPTSSSLYTASPKVKIVKQASVSPTPVKTRFPEGFESDSEDVIHLASRLTKISSKQKDFEEYSKAGESLDDKSEHRSEMANALKTMKSKLDTQKFGAWEAIKDTLEPLGLQMSETVEPKSIKQLTRIFEHGQREAPKRAPEDHQATQTDDIIKSPKRALHESSATQTDAVVLTPKKAEGDSKATQTEGTDRGPKKIQADSKGTQTDELLKQPKTEPKESDIGQIQDHSDGEDLQLEPSKDHDAKLKHVDNDADSKGFEAEDDSVQKPKPQKDLRQFLPTSFASTVQTISHFLKRILTFLFPLFIMFLMGHVFRDITDWRHSTVRPVQFQQQMTSLYQAQKAEADIHPKAAAAVRQAWYQRGPLAVYHPCIEFLDEQKNDLEKIYAEESSTVQHVHRSLTPDIQTAIIGMNSSIAQVAHLNRDIITTSQRFAAMDRRLIRHIQQQREESIHCAAIIPLVKNSTRSKASEKPNGHTDSSTRPSNVRPSPSSSLLNFGNSGEPSFNVSAEASAPGTTPSQVSEHATKYDNHFITIERYLEHSQRGYRYFRTQLYQAREDIRLLSAEWLSANEIERVRVVESMQRGFADAAGRL